MKRFRTLGVGLGCVLVGGLLSAPVPALGHRVHRDFHRLQERVHGWGWPPEGVLSLGWFAAYEPTRSDLAHSLTTT